MGRRLHSLSLQVFRQVSRSSGLKNIQGRGDLKRHFFRCMRCRIISRWLTADFSPSAPTTDPVYTPALAPVPVSVANYQDSCMTGGAARPKTSSATATLPGHAGLVQPVRQAAAHRHRICSRLCWLVRQWNLAPDHVALDQDVLPQFPRRSHSQEEAGQRLEGKFQRRLLISRLSDFPLLFFRSHLGLYGCLRPQASSHPPLCL